MPKSIVITGGPCAGKTTALDVLRTDLVKRGVIAVFVPEAATDLIVSGIAPWTCDSMLQFQTQVIKLQLKREAEAFRQAEKLEAAAMICDRGVCDSRAYLSPADYQRALEHNGLSATDALTRYDAVFHLESIATTQPDAYTNSNNEARFENAHEAVDADARTYAAWSQHPQLRLIPNQETFDLKAAALVQALLAIL